MNSLAEEIQNMNDSCDKKIVYSSDSGGKNEKKSNSSKKPKKFNSKVQVTSVQEEKKETPEAADTAPGMLSLLPDFSSISQYLIWLIILYLIIDRYTTSSKITKHLQSREEGRVKENHISEAEVWDWVFRRSGKDKVEYEKLVETKSNNNTELSKFNKQELYMLRQLKQRELDTLNGLLS